MDGRLAFAPALVADDAPAPFVVELSEYSGPLDLLLTLIRDEKVDIYDIPIARIAEQFLMRIRSLGLDQAADYLEMAARLLRIKAQLLLPRTGSEDEWEDPRAELVRRLLEYQQIREIVDHLELLNDDRRRRFARAYLPEQPAPPQAPLALSLIELLAAVDRVLRVSELPDLHDVIPRPLDVDGAMATVRDVLALRERVPWREVVPPEPERWQILSVLLALLEMARRGELSLEQIAPYSNVWITRESAGQAA
ncbi:MAG TPA: segregation/condensation protein A [Gemmatimonadaceae bacterium]|nr:segregation/condensation protein A [Gemmatimonadaceae bacterium]